MGVVSNLFIIWNESRVVVVLMMRCKEQHPRLVTKSCPHVVRMSDEALTAPPPRGGPWRGSRVLQNRLKEEKSSNILGLTERAR